MPKMYIEYWSTQQKEKINKMDYIIIIIIIGVDFKCIEGNGLILTFFRDCEFDD